MPRASVPDDAWAGYVEELGRNLQRLRHERGLSQEDVAYAAGLSRFTYQQYEKGESRPGTPANPSLKIALALANALESSLLEMLPDALPDMPQP